MKKITILFFVLLFLSCKEQSHLDIPPLITIDVNIDKPNEWIEISNQFESRFIILETNKESRLGVVKKVILHKDELYVFDRQQEQIFVFGLDGLFHRTIIKRGRGPGEVYRTTTFDIFQDKIYVNSLGTKKMVVYDLSGEVLEDIKFPDYVGMRFHVLDDGFISNWGGESNKSATFYNKKGKASKTIVNEKYTDLRYLTMNCFSSHGQDTLFMNFANNDTIYLVDNEKKTLKAHLFIDFHEKRVPIEILKNADELENYKIENKYISRTRFHYNSSDLYMMLGYGKEYMFLFYDSDKKQINHGRRISYQGFQIGSVVGEWDEGLISLWSPDLAAKNKHMNYIFLPDTCMYADVNWNPGIVILRRKKL